MAFFTVTIETPTRTKPVTRAEDIEERARLQSTLLTIVSRVSNCADLDGEINHPGVTAKFGYET